MVWSATNFNHDFFPLTGGHNIECSACHGQGGNFTGLSTDCYSCHRADFEATTDPNHVISRIFDKTALTAILLMAGLRQTLIIIKRSSLLQDHIKLLTVHHAIHRDIPIPRWTVIHVMSTHTMLQLILIIRLLVFQLNAKPAIIRIHLFPQHLIILTQDLN